MTAPGRPPVPPARRLASVAVAAATVAATAAVVVPQHAATLAAVAAATVAVVASGFLLVVVGAVADRARPTSTLDREPPGGAPALEPVGLRDARTALAAAPGEDGLPTPIRERLAAVAALGLSRVGADVTGLAPEPAAGTGPGSGRLDVARRHLSPAAAALLGPAPAPRPRGRRTATAAEAAATATRVAGLLDELEPLAGIGLPPSPTHPARPPHPEHPR